MHPTPTWSPTLNFSTWVPTPDTTPASSCPGTKQEGLCGQALNRVRSTAYLKCECSYIRVDEEDIQVGRVHAVNHLPPWGTVSCH